MLAVRNAKILTVTNGIIENGTILIKDGEIVSVGQMVVIPEKADVLDCSGKWVVPSLIDLQEGEISGEEDKWFVSLARQFGFTRVGKRSVCEEKGLKQDPESELAIVRPLDFSESPEMRWKLQFQRLIEMEQNGIEFCFSRDNGSGPRLLLSIIGMAIAAGVSLDVALRSLTINPAKVLRLEQEVGSIEAGKRAEIAIFDGNPFGDSSSCEAVVVGGAVYRGCGD